ncbi:acyl-CoA carboxylase subunit beta [Mumia zhuanghuii]|uniref:Acyl-CoA carboxylase subunit beta n=1 Tax=Mumia zhuanghuii TaxID=2585211 RepID=A0A5Q6RWJ2_9ACTN|nr:acyl-CoA carboxylase subunit beta [Mumia zhuanghuii]
MRACSKPAASSGRRTRGESGWSLIGPTVPRSATPVGPLQGCGYPERVSEAVAPESATPANGQIDTHTTAGKLADLDRRLDEAVHAGSAKAIEKQHAKGRQTARERIEMLFDEGSFVEIDELARHRSTAFGLEKNRPYGDGVITGYGTVDGRQVCVFSQDFTVFGGSLGEVYGEKITKIMDLAIKTGSPIVGINEGAGARIQEGVVSLGLYGEIFRRNVHASGVIPQISLIMGSCAGGHVYSPAVTDFTVMVDGTSNMFITGPDVIKTVTGEDVTMEELGGARAHNTKSGNAHYMGADEEDAIEYVKALLSYLPQNNMEDAPSYDEGADLDFSDVDLALDTLIPDSPNQPYDMHTVIESIVDDGEFLEVQPLFAPNILIGFGRVEGRSVGIVANQPMQFAGTLDIDASEKAARFVRTCDAFNVPVLTFVDVPGFLPGTDQEWTGIIRRGAKLIYAYAEATVPLVTVITRKAYGGAYDVMGSKHLGADLNIAWPTAQIAVMGAQGAVNILHRKTLAAADDPEAKRVELIDEYEQTLANPYIAAERGYVDQVVQPHETRVEIVRALRLLRSKRETLPPKKHGNIPL